MWSPGLANQDVKIEALAGGRYRWLRDLPPGGMATVHVVLDTRLRVQRVLKVLRPSLALSARLRERFCREAETMAALDHPHVVPIRDFLQERGVYAILMDLMPGGSLSDLVNRAGPTPPGQALALLEGVLRALSAAHAAEIIHRDIKPANVLLDGQGLPRVSDFGIALLTADGRGRLTREGQPIGTPDYRSPEQERGDRATDHRADLYSAGATLYAISTGRPPIALDRKEPDHEDFSLLPASLQPLVVTATRAEPAARYASAEQMLLAVEQARGG